MIELVAPVSSIDPTDCDVPTWPVAPTTWSTDCDDDGPGDPSLVSGAENLPQRWNDLDRHDSGDDHPPQPCATCGKFGHDTTACDDIPF